MINTKKGEKWGGSWAVKLEDILVMEVPRESPTNM
jgi:hypothetical protein